MEDADPLIARHRTALRRFELSRPIRFAIQDFLITPATSVLDYGCGQGDDLRRLREQGISCAGWDPFFAPLADRQQSDVVNLGYVVNVIEDTAERAKTVADAWSLAGKLLIISARLTSDLDSGIRLPYADGYLTRLGTFQKLYEQQELRNWIDTTLGESCVAASPGVFYVFKDQELKYAYVASHIRQAAARPRLLRSHERFEAHRSLFEELIQFLLARGRLPVDAELPSGHRLAEAIGSIRRAFAILQRVTGAEQWEHIRTQRAQDLLVYLALSRFSRRPRFCVLPDSLQLDLRAFFSNYKHACELADDLLFSVGDRAQVERACRGSGVGKITPTALYVHTSALSSLAPILRVYEGCARALTGTVDGSNIVKLHFIEPTVSYLSYPAFETDAHPALASSLWVHLRAFKMRQRLYREAENPPILHRKEEFVPKDDPMRSKYERLTRQEERRGLYEHPSDIGMRAGWERALAAKGLRIAGHRLLRGD